MTDLLQTQGGRCSRQQRPVLLITTVEIGQGQPATINVREGDDTYAVARDFVLSHGLPEHIIPELSQHLKQNLQAQMEQQAQWTVGKGNAVFDRLYQQALDLRDKLDEQREWVREYEVELLKACRPRMTWISMAMMRDRGAGPFSNYGEMLYVESLHRMQLKQEKVAKLREELEADDVVNMTFTPQLSPRSKQLWQQTHAGVSTPAWKRLNELYKSVKERIEQQRQEKEQKEEHACTFKPVISSKSQKLAQQAEQRYAAAATTATMPLKTAARGVCGTGEKQNAEATSEVPLSPRKLTAEERLYGDAMRCMHKLQTITQASTPGSLHSTPGALRASTAGHLASFGNYTAARAAARVTGTTVAGSISDKCARQTTSGGVRSTVAGHSKQSQAGTLMARPSCKRQAWH